MIAFMFLPSNEYNIRGYYDRRNIVVNLGYYFIYWSVFSSSRRERYVVKGAGGGYRYISQLGGPFH